MDDLLAGAYGVLAFALGIVVCKLADKLKEKRKAEEKLKDFDKALKDHEAEVKKEPVDTGVSVLSSGEPIKKEVVKDRGLDNN